jgi:hypothetical protein
MGQQKTEQTRMNAVSVFEHASQAFSTASAAILNRLKSQSDEKGAPKIGCTSMEAGGHVVWCAG